MVRSVKGLRYRPLVARDGAIGFLVDVYFDDRTWNVRYLVLDTGRPMPRRQVLVWSIASLVVDNGWLPGRRSFIAPGEVAGIDWIERTVRVRRSQDPFQRTAGKGS